MSGHARPPFTATPPAWRNMSFNIYAQPLPDGRWGLLSSHQAALASYPDKAAALSAARGQCLREWEETGNAYGIRVRDLDGAWSDAPMFWRIPV